MVEIIKNGKENVSLKVFNRDAKISERKHVPQFIIIRCGMTHIIKSLKQMGITYGLHEDILRKEMALYMKNNVYEGNNINEDTWKSKKLEWMDYVKNEILCTDICFARCSTRIGASTGFGMKNSLILHSLG